MAIILAKTVKDVEFTGEYDIAWKPIARVINRAVAVCWANRPRKNDLERAKAFAEENGYAVYQLKGHDILGQAKALIMEETADGLEEVKPYDTRPEL